MSTKAGTMGFSARPALFTFWTVTVSVLAAAALILSAVALNVAGRGDRSVTSMDATARTGAAPVDRQQTSSSWGMDREALVQAGYTGRLGATTEAGGTIASNDWRERALAAGYTGRAGV